MIDYDKVLSDKIKKIKPSGIRKFFDIAGTMENVISLGVGEPDFETPWHISEEGIYSLEKGRTFYNILPPFGFILYPTSLFASLDHTIDRYYISGVTHI